MAADAFLMIPAFTEPEMSPVDTLDDISSALAALVPEVEVEIRGEWTSSLRRTSASDAQTGSEHGPFEVEDMYWRATIDCDAPLTGIAFLRTAREIFWAKAGGPVDHPLVEISLHAWATRVDGRATFSARLMGSGLPGVPVGFSGNAEASCKLGAPRFATGRVHVVAAAGDAIFSVILLPGAAIRMGRKKIWRLRDELAVSLPDHVRSVLTRGRTGTIPIRTGDADLVGS